jgi:hypothetical protein
MIMGLEDELARAFSTALDGNKVYEQIGDWGVKITPHYQPQFADLTYRPREGAFADYVFFFHSLFGHIEFTNYHRYAEGHVGTVSLKELEGGFEVLARNRATPVEVVFELVKQQEDTKAWLSRNGYQIIDGKYKKWFEPVLIA